MKRNRTPDAFYGDAERWREELAALRKVMLQTGLTEEIKWGLPCYTLDGAHIVGVGAFKSYFGLWFHQGALLKDEKGVLESAREGVTRANRQWRMTSAKDIKPAIIKAYVKEAIANQNAGRAIKADRTKTLEMPAELSSALKKDKTASAAFKALTPGKQREYANYIAAAKQDATRRKRIEKILPMIADGRGLNDKYRR